MTVTKIIFHKSKLYRNILKDDNGKIIFIKNCTISIIIDKIKKLFGFENFNRKIIVMPSQKEYMIETHIGYERKIRFEEINNIEVIKIKTFRWLLGLSNSNVYNDIIVRYYLGRKFYISYRDTDIEYNKNYNIPIDKDINPYLLIEEMLYGFNIDLLKESIKNIINEIDSSHIYLADYICRKINVYELLK